MVKLLCLLVTALIVFGQRGNTFKDHEYSEDDADYYITEELFDEVEDVKEQYDEYDRNIEKIHDEDNNILEENANDIDTDVLNDQANDPPSEAEKIEAVLRGITKMVNRQSWSRYYKKVFPGRFPGPKSFRDRIAVVGAGPSGIHMAYLLKKRGFKNIKIFEETNRIGGKSKSIHYRGAIHEMGTCFYAGGYERIMQLVRKFTNSVKIPAKLTYVWNSTTTESVPLEIEKYIVQAIMAENPGITVLEAKKKLTLQMIKYLKLHIKIFGISRGQLPPKPQNMQHLRGHFLDFLKRNELSDLHHLFVSTQTLQGYGQLDEVPTLYGLMWNTPALVIGALAAFTGGEPSFGIISEGFQDLWEQIARKSALDIQYNSKVMNVELADGDPSTSIRMQVSVNAEEVQIHEADFVVWAVRAKSSLWSFTGVDMKEERELFQGMTHSYYTTSLINEIGTKRSQAPEDWFFTNIKDDHRNLVWADRDSYSVMNRIYGPSYEQAFNETGDDESKKRTLVVYQYSVSEDTPRTVDLMTEIDKHFKDLGATSYSVVDQNKWLYFPRFNQTQTEEGNHWKLLDIQGKNNVWYIGGSTSFESVKSCVEYNLMMVNRMEMPKRKGGRKCRRTRKCRRGHCNCNFSEIFEAYNLTC